MKNLFLVLSLTASFAFAKSYNLNEVRVFNENVEFFSVQDFWSHEDYQGAGYDKITSFETKQKIVKNNDCYADALNFARRINSDDTLAEFFIMPSLTVAYDRTQREGFIFINFEFDAASDDSILFTLSAQNQEGEKLILNEELIEADKDGNCSFESATVNTRKKLVKEFRQFRNI